MSDTEENTTAEGLVVVGIDGSEGSRAALEFAMDEAALRNLRLLAVMVYEPPDLWVFTVGLTADLQGMRHAVEKNAAALVESVTEARTQRGAPVPPVTVEVQSGPASPVLERLSRGANLLVVGHRGRGEVATKLIGSIGLNCVVHAHCTVVVVRS